jgi:hypothetical protein
MGPGSKLEIRRVTDMSDCEDFSDNDFQQKAVCWRAELDEP